MRIAGANMSNSYQSAGYNAAQHADIWYVCVCECVVVETTIALTVKLPNNEINAPFQLLADGSASFIVSNCLCLCANVSEQ